MQEEFNLMCQSGNVRGVIPNTQDSKVEILKHFNDCSDRFSVDPDEYRRCMTKKGQFQFSELKKARDIADEKIMKLKVVESKHSGVRSNMDRDAFAQLIDGLEWSEPYSDQMQL